MATTTTQSATSARKTGIGDSRGFYFVLGESALTTVELAHVMSTDIEDVREWLVDQVRRGYVLHEPATHRFATPRARAASAEVHQIAA